MTMEALYVLEPSSSKLLAYQSGRVPALGSMLVCNLEADVVALAQAYSCHARFPWCPIAVVVPRIRLSFGAQSSGGRFLRAQRWPGTFDAEPIGPMPVLHWKFVLLRVSSIKPHRKWFRAARSDDISGALGPSSRTTGWP
jgi:hypothetical protein